MRLALAAALLLGLAASHQAVPVDPAKLVAHDFHQGILVACDSYQNAQRAKKAIGKENPLKAGIVPVDVYVRNTTRWPVAITLHTIRLELVPPGGEREQLDPLGAGDVATEILHPKHPDLRAPRRLPLPFPQIGRGKKWQKLRDKLQSLAFPAAVVAPGATVHGFFYFNLRGDYGILEYARLYVPDLKFLGNTQSIMFFEAPFSPAAGP